MNMMPKTTTPMATHIHRMSMCRSYTILLIGVTPTGRFRSHAARASVPASASIVKTAMPEPALRPGVLLCIFQSLRFMNSSGAGRASGFNQVDQGRGQPFALGLGQKLAEDHLLAV